MKKLLRWFLTVVGLLLGVGLVSELLSFLVESKLLSPDHADIYPWVSLVTYILGASLFAASFYFFSIPCGQAALRLMRRVESRLSSVPVMDLIFGTLGLLLGVLLSFLIMAMFARGQASLLYTVLGVAVYLLFGYLGTTLGMKRWRELNFAWVRRLQQQTARSTGQDEALPSPAATSAGGARPKLLDTSVIIDGRIFDLCKTGFLEGTLVLPNFVLRELRHISDSSDALKRNRGRRGLDVLARIQKELRVPVEVDDQDFPDEEVDVKLLKLAKLRDGCVLTTDYNLNKVAGVSGIPVLNINDLANALKPVALPGEEREVLVVKEGKELNQGVGYLDDGTMIVVENGKRAIGQTVTVLVTSVLQTSAGRMIFAKMQE
ncbi:MAG: PIN/TRAM domain-containing protein [Candidatus Spyradocola sp.]